MQEVLFKTEAILGEPKGPNASLEIAIAGWEEQAESCKRLAEQFKNSADPFYRSDVKHLMDDEKRYRNVALALKLELETGIQHCSCTTPPHKKGTRHENGKPY